MKCSEILELLPLYAEEMLEKSEMKAVKEHLKECESCSKELEFIENIMKEAVMLPEIEPSADFSSKLKDRLILENQKQKKLVNIKKAWKTFAAVAASAAVIAVSVTALNTEFYKIDNSALNGKSENAVEKTAKEADVTQKAIVMQNEENSEEKETAPEPINGDVVFSEKRTEDYGDQKAKDVSEPAPQEENLQTEEPEQAIEPQTEKNDAAEKAQVPEKAAEETEKAAATFTLETGDVAEEAAATEAFDESQPEENDTGRASGGGGGGAKTSGSSARNAKIALRYDKTVLNVKIPEGDESIKAILQDFTFENGEYKLPQDAFYKAADEIFAVPDVEAYYTNESFTEEYNTLKEKAANEDIISETEKRISEIEEICKYGYIVIK